MVSAELVEIYNYFYTNSSRPPGTRDNSICIEDAFFGDSGKGSVVAKLNELLKSDKGLYSIRYNGGGNAGHESYLRGLQIVTHQLPMGVVCEGATAIISRGMAIHPHDLLTEIKQISGKFGGELPGNLLIDRNTLLALDTHKALEETYNSLTPGGSGSTGRGIAPAYASLYERHPVFLDDLLEENWEEKLRDHYHLYAKKIQGFGSELANTEIHNMATPKGEKYTVGTEAEFIDRLAECRDQIKKYVHPNMQELLEEIWRNPEIPFTIEGAQGIGLDVYHGVYPDVTASRPGSRYITDATYGIIEPDDVLRLAVMKTTYMSSVGRRTLPTITDPSWERWVQQTFDETGRSTARLRDIYPISLPIARYLKRAAGFDALVATHLDALRKEVPIKVITHYIDKVTGEDKPYSPYQKDLDKLEAKAKEFPGWDGEALKQAKSVMDLPKEVIEYLNFLRFKIAPVVMMTTGPDLDQYIFNGDHRGKIIRSP